MLDWSTKPALTGPDRDENELERFNVGNRFMAGIAGAVGIVVAFGVTELFHGLYESVPSVLGAIAQVIVELTPGGIVTQGIELLGTADIPVLIASVVLGIAGDLALPRRSWPPAARPSPSRGGPPGRGRHRVLARRDVRRRGRQRSSTDVAASSPSAWSSPRRMLRAAGPESRRTAEPAPRPPRPVSPDFPGRQVQGGLRDRRHVGRAAGASWRSVARATVAGLVALGLGRRSPAAAHRAAAQEA